MRAYDRVETEPGLDKFVNDPEGNIYMPPMVTPHCPTWPSSILPCVILPCVTLPCFTLPCVILSSPMLPCPVPPCLVLPPCSSCPVLSCPALPCPHPALGLPCPVLPSSARALHHQWDNGHIHAEYMQTFSHKCMPGPFVATSMYSSTFFTISSALVTWLPTKGALLFQN